MSRRAAARLLIDADQNTIPAVFRHHLNNRFDDFGEIMLVPTLRVRLMGDGGGEIERSSADLDGGVNNQHF